MRNQTGFIKMSGDHGCSVDTPGKKTISPTSPGNNRYDVVFPSSLRQSSFR
jgi:hypothetical protein